MNIDLNNIQISEEDRTILRKTMVDGNIFDISGLSDAEAEAAGKAARRAATAVGGKLVLNIIEDRFIGEVIPKDTTRIE